MMVCSLVLFGIVGLGESAAVAAPKPSCYFAGTIVKYLKPTKKVPLEMFEYLISKAKYGDETAITCEAFASKTEQVQVAVLGVTGKRTRPVVGTSVYLSQTFQDTETEVNGKRTYGAIVTYTRITKAVFDQRAS
jgi:hypothetical protein